MLLALCWCCYEWMRVINVEGSNRNVSFKQKYNENYRNKTLSVSGYSLVAWHGKNWRRVLLCGDSDWNDRIFVFDRDEPLRSTIRETQWTQTKFSLFCFKIYPGRRKHTNTFLTSFYVIPGHLYKATFIIHHIFILHL